MGNMAEVRQLHLRVKHVFGFVFREQRVFESHSRPGKCSNIAAAFLLAGTSNDAVSGAGTAAGHSQGSYTSPAHLSRADYDDVFHTIHYGNDPLSSTRAEKHPPRQVRGPLCGKHRIKVCRTFFNGPICLLRLQWGPSANTRSYSGNGSRAEPLYKSKSGYYDILQVAATATQAQIKTAYYKQSFIYHPDRNAGKDEATVRFSEISEAYAVLGNKGLRRKYDRGLLSQADLVSTPPRSSGKDPRATSSKQQRSSQSVMGAGSRGSIFDFDTFFKSHYGEQLQRQRNIRIRKEELQRKKEEALKEKDMGKMMEIGVGLLFVVAMGLLLSLKK